MEWIEALIGLVGIVVGWILKSKLEELRAEREKLRSERRKVYGEILDPYIRLFAGLKGDEKAREKHQREALKQLASFEYRKNSFDLSLFGDDNVVRAYNDLMQHAFQAAQSEQEEKHHGIKMIKLWGKLLLEIRKSLGNKKTKLTEKDMLRSMIVDIDTILPD